MVYQTLHSSSFPILGPSLGTSVWKPGHREVLTSAAGRAVKMWDLERGGPGLKSVGTDVEMRQVAWSKDGHLFATLGDKEAVVWKSDDFSRLSTLQLDPEVFLPDAVLRRFNKHKLESIQFNGSGRLLAVLQNGFPGFVHVFDAMSGVCIKTVYAGVTGQYISGFQVYTPAFAWRNELEFFCSGYRKITHHKDGQDAPVQVLPSRNLLIIDMTFNQESGTLAWCAGRYGVELWSPPQQTPSFIHTDKQVIQVMWHPQNATILAGTLCQECQTQYVSYDCIPFGLRLWDTATKTILQEILEDVIPTAPYNDISFSPDGRFLALLRVNVSVWKVSTGEKVAVCKTEGGAPAKVSWSPSGEKLAVNVDSNNSVSVFDMENIVTTNLKTLYQLSMIRVAKCLKGNKKNGPYDVEKLLKEQEVPGKFVNEINAYLE